MAGFQIGQFVSGGGSSVLIAVPAGSLVLTGYAPAVKTPRTIQVPAGSLVLTGYAPTVLTPRRVLVPAAGLVLTGYAPTVVAPATIPIPAGGLVLTGYAPTVRTPRVVQVPAASLVLTGFAPVVLTPRTVVVPAGSLVLTGYAPTVVAGAVTVAVPAGSLVLTGYAPVVVATVTVADTGPTPAGSKRRGRPPKRFVVEWNGRIYHVEGEREALVLLAQLRAQAEKHVPAQAKTLARRAVKQDSEPPIDPPHVAVSGDATIGAQRAAEQAQAQLAALYEREAERAYIAALEWHLARLRDDHEALTLLVLDDDD